MRHIKTKNAADKAYRKLKENPDRHQKLKEQNRSISQRNRQKPKSAEEKEREQLLQNRRQACYVAKEKAEMAAEGGLPAGKMGKTIDGPAMESTDQCLVYIDTAQDYVMLDDSDDESDTQSSLLPLQPDSERQNGQSRVTLGSNQHSTRERPLCEQCGKTFASDQALTVHTRIHSGEKPFRCEFCSEVFTQNSDMRIHIRRIHTKQKPYTCKECGKAFSSSGSLARHKKIHMSQNRDVEWSLTCQICGVRCITKHAFKEHLQTHSGEVHECDLCRKTFKRARDLAWHRKKQHDGPASESQVLFQCRHCKKSYRFPNSLAYHVRTKHGKKKGVKSHKCGECSASFPNSWDLKVHLRIHTGEQPYKCQVCDAAFRYHHALKRHHLTLHQGKRSK